MFIAKGKRTKGKCRNNKIGNKILKQCVPIRRKEMTIKIGRSMSRERR